jgi:hypothetical protein
MVSFLGKRVHHEAPIIAQRAEDRTRSLSAGALGHLGPALAAGARRRDHPPDRLEPTQLRALHIGDAVTDGALVLQVRRDPRHPASSLFDEAMVGWRAAAG